MSWWITWRSSPTIPASRAPTQRYRRGRLSAIRRLLGEIADRLRRGSPENAIASVDAGGNVRKLADVEEELIRFALKFYRGQMSQVARKLGIGRSTLYRKLKDYGIDPDDPQKDAA